MKDKTVYAPSFFELLTLLFIGLRAAKVITWPWVWVLSPLWLPMSIAVIIACVLVLLGK